MKNKVLIICCLVAFLNTSATLAQIVTNSEAKKTAENFCRFRTKSVLSGLSPYELSEAGQLYARVYALEPLGFVIVPADQRLPAIFAWSEESNFTTEDNRGAAMGLLLISDMKLRLLSWNHYSQAVKSEIENSWSSYDQQKGGEKFDQWPASGTTSTGGWLETNWTQSSPYNALCPMDLNAGSRSIAGCPAVAMGQILNNLQKTNGTRFDNSDDYYHSYGTGNQYWIDNDSAAHDFPGFGTLNFLLDSLDMYYSNKANLSNNMKACLIFACGTACKQVYTASGSGTFGVDQAYDAYLRFGFSDSRLIYDTDTSLKTDLANNMKAGLCAHLALVDSAVTVGHNVVVDGYNTDDLFHFNFGWGGSYNGWYTMPPTSIPYSLTVIEGLVLDIDLDTTPSAIHNIRIENGIRYYPNPVENLVHIDLGSKYDSLEITVFDGPGREVYRNIYMNISEITLDMATWQTGMYILQCSDLQGLHEQIKIIKQ